MSYSRMGVSWLLEDAQDGCSPWKMKALSDAAFSRENESKQIAEGPWWYPMLLEDRGFQFRFTQIVRFCLSR
jgi:hypothetical protein